MTMAVSIRHASLRLFVSIAIFTLTVRGACSFQIYRANDLGEYSAYVDGSIYSALQGFPGKNSAGQILINSSPVMNVTGDFHATLRQPSGPSAGTNQIVPLAALPPGRDDTETFSINDYGQIVGVSGWPTDPRPVLWQPAAPNSDQFLPVALSPRSDDVGSANSINRFGQIVGEVGSLNSHPFLWQPNQRNGDEGALIDLSLAEPSMWDYGSAVSLNNVGQIVGDINTYSAFCWDPDVPNGTSGNMIQLDRVSGAPIQVTSINDFGTTVGYEASLIHASNALIWDSAGHGYNLQGFLDSVSSAEWTLTDAIAINDEGQIVCGGIHNDDSRTVLLTPTPEPSTICLLIIVGCTTLVFAASRRLKGASARLNGGALNKGPLRCFAGQSADAGIAALTRLSDCALL